MKRRKRKNKIIILGIFLLLIMTVGYAAFQTNINITAKGNIKDLQKEVDAQVPTNELLFWGQANNPENTLTTLKDKSGNNNDGILYNFDSTDSSGYKDDELIFDGIDDHINLGFENYLFDNNISYVIYMKIDSTLNKTQSIFGNWEFSGGGIWLDRNKLCFDYHDGSDYIELCSELEIISDNYYTIIGILNENALKLYIDDTIITTNITSKLTQALVPMLIGANPNKDYLNNQIGDQNSKMSFKEAMLYDRALTSEEVNQITKGFERKYKNS